MTEAKMNKILEEVADAPASGNVDGQTFSSHNIKDLIALDRYLATKRAAANGKSGIRFTKIEGGSVND